MRYKETQTAVFVLCSSILASVLLLPGPWAWPAAAREPRPAPLARAVESVGFTVSDADRSAVFFSEVLTFAKVSETEVTGGPFEQLTGVFGLRLRVVRMRLGSEHVELVEVLAPRGRPIPADSRSNDHWFQHAAIIVSDMDRAYRRLRAHRVRHASPAPQRLPDWNPNAGGIEAFYFKDPDGHVLEILEFPEGKGDPRWRARNGDEPLFLGIDHTAIVVADTDESLRFYRDLLGLEVAGKSENWGPEQERLNDVFGARLRITTLRAPRGPGIELLEYLAPRDGRPAAEDWRANDLVHWHTRLDVGDLDTVAARLRRDRVRLVSPGIVKLPDDPLGFEAGLRAHDPDRHVIELTGR